MNYARQTTLITLGGIIIFIIDRITKHLFYFDQICERCFLISPIKNKGIAFGINWPDKFNFIFYFLISIIFLFLSSWLIKSIRQQIIYKISVLNLIILGSASNIIDRIKYGGVIDFIDFKIWPVFNVADIMIVAGVIYLILKMKKLKK